MEVNDILEIFKSMGNKVSEVSSWIIKQMGEAGVKASLLQVKIVTLIINLVLLYMIIKFIQIPKKIVKILIVILLVILASSIIISMF